MKLLRIILALSVACVLPGLVLGTTVGKITGVVTDAQTKEPLVGVSVQVVGTTMGAVSDAEGAYTILNVPVGTYTLKLSLVGYAEVQISNVEVSADLASYQNQELSSRVTDIGKTIQVTAERPLVVKDATSSISIVKRDQIQALPTRGFEQVVGLQTGVVKIQRSPAIAFRGARESVNTNELNLRGGRPSEVAYYVDGFSQQDPLSGNSTANISNNAIKEVSVLAGGFSAEYGNVASGVVNTITASGGEKYSGNFEAVTDNVTKDNYDNNYYSVDLSGPIPISKLSSSLGKAYFFGSVERRYLGDRNPSAITKDILSGNPNMLPHNMLDGWSYQGKLDFEFKPTMKLSFSGNGSLDKWYEYRHDYLFDIQHTPYYRDENLGLNSKFTHTVNAKTYYNLSASYFMTSRFRGDGFYKENIWAYGRPTGNPSFPSGDPYFWFGDDENTPRVIYDSTGQILYTVDTVISVDGVRRKFSAIKRDDSNRVMVADESSLWDDYLKRKSSYIGFKGDITSQVVTSHTLKGGFEFQRHTLRYYRHLFPTLVWKGLSGGGFQDIDRYGYDYLGNESDDEGALNATKHPINFAAYVQDRAEWTGLIVNAGLRFDYFDYRAKRLKNPDNPLDPDSLGDKMPNPPASINALDESDLEPSKKFTRVSPRFGVAFPVSDRTQVHMNYGKFYQRPDLVRLYVGYDFFEYKVKNGGYFYPMGNPNLEPEKTTSYEVGMTHQLGDFTALEVSAYYKDVLGLVQVLNQAAQPNSFTFYKNSDYSTIKGLEFNLAMRRNHNIEMNIKYTLAYANGTGSYANTQQNIAWTAGQSPKQTAALDYDQRHNVVAIFDYRTGENQGPRVGDYYPLENFGINVVTQLASGTPYTPSATFDEITLAAVQPNPDATRNTAYGPWSLNIDLKAERAFKVGAYKVTPYVWVKNLLDRKNEYVVYESSGRANSTGWLETPPGQDFQNSTTTPGHTGLNGTEEYRLKENNPQNYGIPRMILFGLRMSF